MSARAVVALAVTLSSLSLAGAQPNIPPSELPGRERELVIEHRIRFLEAWNAHFGR